MPWRINIASSVLEMRCLYSKSMIKPIVKDVLFLGQKSSEATKDDLYIATDLRDTLEYHKEGCVGMAANMIGYKKKVIIFTDAEVNTVMFNPRIIKKSRLYHTQEGCLSLTGIRPASRYEDIVVQYFDESFIPQIKAFSGFTAQIIQHEIDHLNGIII